MQAVRGDLRVGDFLDLPPEIRSPGQSLLVFVRHTGCPFAERDIKRARAWAAENPEVQVIVVTHGDEGLRDTWVADIGGAEGLTLYHDPERCLYGQAGLGFSAASHFMGFPSLLGVMRLWREGTRNRSASGTRWQRAGVLPLKDGKLVWRNIPESAEGFRLPQKSSCGK